jgi:hypothetical protein
MDGAAAVGWVKVMRSRVGWIVGEAQCLRNYRSWRLPKTFTNGDHSMKKLSRREFVHAGVLAGVGLAATTRMPGAGAALAAATPPAALPSTFSLETYAQRSINYFERLVDADGLPYFNVFWSEPAEAAHDWPCLGDVMPRQLEAAVMLRRMTGIGVVTEPRWRSMLFAHLHPHDGQFHRPARSWQRAKVEDAALPLGALNAAALDGDGEARKAAVKMAEGYLRRLQDRYLPEKTFSCFAVKSLMVTARLLGSDAALAAARLLVERHVVRGRAFNPDNTFGPKAHMHGNLKAMTGVADYALTVGDPVLYSRMDALYRHVKSTGTRFGFLPEVVNWRPSDMIASETCAMMDFAGIGVTLANHGHPEYWGDMERLARNHLVESQVRDVSWLQSDDVRPDTQQFTWREIGPRIVGAWAGWSSPNHILAYRETLNAHWGGPELRDKIRLLQNCCGGSGVHALFILWKNAARFADGTLSVNMHLDKRLPEAEIRCEQPYRGALRIDLRQGCAVRVRIPEFTEAGRMRLLVNGQTRSILQHGLRSGSLLGDSWQNEKSGPPAAEAVGNFLELGRFAAGDRIEVLYPVPVVTEEIAVGNPGFRQWHYRVTWKGDTVVRLEPIGNDVKTVWSDFDKMDREVFYGEEGPGALYQREAMLRESSLADAPLHTDDGGLDLWQIAGRVS